MNKPLKNMRSIEVSDKELEVIIVGLIERENVMFKAAKAYRNMGDKESQFDCILEWKTAQHLRERLQEAVRTYQDRERARVREEADDRVEWLKELERDRRDGAGTD